MHNLSQKKNSYILVIKKIPIFSNIFAAHYKMFDAIPHTLEQIPSEGMQYIAYSTNR